MSWLRCRGHAWKVRVTTPPASTVRATRNHRLHAAPCFGAAALGFLFVLKSAAGPPSRQASFHLAGRALTSLSGQLSASRSWPRRSLSLCCASRPSRPSGVCRSAQRQAVTPTSLASGTSGKLLGYCLHRQIERTVCARNCCVDWSREDSGLARRRGDRADRTSRLEVDLRVRSELIPPSAGDGRFVAITRTSPNFCTGRYYSRGRSTQRAV